VQPKTPKQHQNKLSKDHNYWKMDYLESKEGFGSLCIWLMFKHQSVKMFFCSTTTPKTANKPAKEWKRNKNKTMACKLVSTHYLI